MRKMEVEEDYTNLETGEIQKQTVERLVEIDVDDKALAISTRIDSVPYSIFAINQAA